MRKIQFSGFLRTGKTGLISCQCNAQTQMVLQTIKHEAIASCNGIHDENNDADVQLCQTKRQDKQRKSANAFVFADFSDPE